MKIDNFDDDFEFIDYDLTINNEGLDYNISTKLKMSNNKIKIVEISKLFISKEEMEEAGINKSNRIITAKNLNGYEQLLAMGFTHQEIIKNYDTKKSNKPKSK